MAGHRWTLDDGTTIHSGGVVVGRSELAEQLRSVLARAVASGTITVMVEPPETEDGPVTNDWMLHQWIVRRSHSGRPGMAFTFTTDYVPKLEDAPMHVQDFVRWCERHPRKPGVVY